MKKLSKTALRWWGAIIVATSMICPVFGQDVFPFPEDIRNTYELTVFQDNLYAVAHTGRWGNVQLCRFDGTDFTILPQALENDMLCGGCPLVEYNDNLYMIVTQYTDSYVLPPDPVLVRFNGSSFTTIPIPFGRVPTDLNKSDLQVYNGKLYIDVAEHELGHNSGFVAYNGTNFELINFPVGMMSNNASGMTVYKGKLFRLLSNLRTSQSQLVSYDGSRFETYPIRDLMTAKMSIYNDNLILTQGVPGGEQRLLAFNGTTAVVIRSPSYWPTSSDAAILDERLYLRMVIPFAPLETQVVAYDGTVFNPIITVPGLRSEFATWRDKVWFSGGTSGSYNLYSYRPLGSGGGSAGVGHVIYDFERIEFDLNAQGRGWCWNETIIDWDINPICLTPPLCPEAGDPVWLTLLDKNKTVWEAPIKDQSQLIIPVADNPYTLSLATEKSKLRQEFLTIDNDLVGMGLERIKLGLKPMEGNLSISLATKQNKTVPVTLSLLNNKGEAVWQEDVVAPAQKQLSVKSKEPGSKFVIAPAGATLESAGITAATYFPNPFDGKITVDLQTKGDKIPVQVTIDDPNGKRVIDAALTAPVKQTLEIKDKKPGFYVLTFSAGGASRQAKIELK